MTPFDLAPEGSDDAHDDPSDLAVVRTLRRPAPARARETPVLEVQGSLALELRTLPPPPQPLPSLRALAVPGRADRDDAARSGDEAADEPLAARGPIPPVARRRIGPAAAHDSEATLDAWSRRFSRALVEVMTGYRPAPQLVRATTPEVYAEVSERAAVVTARGLRPRASGQHVPRVRSVRVAVLRDGVAELAVHVGHGGRSRAIAARAELREGRWQCCVLQFG